MALFSLETANAVSFFTCAPLRQHGVVLHAFSTRLGSVSQPPDAAINLGLGSGDNSMHIHGNRARFGQALAIDPGDLVTLRQVHGNRIILVTETTDPQLVRGLPGDGLITDRPHLPLAVVTADCFPVILAVPSLPAVGLVHAGRKGTAAGVVPAAIELISHAFGVLPVAVLAAIGPGIGQCCYEVDDESAEPFHTQFSPNDSFYRPSRPGHLYLDLQGVIRRQLRDAGVPSTQIWHADLCTACHPHWFYSYRRDGAHSGRMLNVVMLRSDTPSPWT